VTFPGTPAYRPSRLDRETCFEVMPSQPLYPVPRAYHACCWPPVKAIYVIRSFESHPWPAMRCSLRNTAAIATVEAGTSPLPSSILGLFPDPNPIPFLSRAPPEEVLSRADQTSYAGLDSHSLALCSNVIRSLLLFHISYTLVSHQLDHLQRLSVIKSDTQRNEDPLYCTRRLCESGHEDAVMLNLIVRGFVVSLDILPLSRFDGKR